MPVSQLGSLNATALIVPDLYVQVVPPQQAELNGVPTDILGLVGTAAWGPLDSPVIVGSMADYAAQFGPVQDRPHDLGTALAVATQQGASDFRCVRVSDGTDTAASASITQVSGNSSETACGFTSLYTGSLANGDSIAIVDGSNSTSAAHSYRVQVQRAGQVAEVFDNISDSGAGVWQSIVNAINNGQGPLRGRSQLVVATAGSVLDDPTVPTTVTLSGGSDGVASVTSSVLMGQDTVPRKGLYSLRNTGASVAFIADLTDTATFPAQVAYGLSEGTYVIGVTQAGDTIGNGTSSGAIYEKKQSGLDSYAFKYLFGDWIYWNDTVNGLVRLVSPQGFVAGKLVALSPEQSSLNKPLYGVVGTQKSSVNQVYSSAELQALIQAGIDVVTNPVPGGNYFGCRAGHNCSSNPLTNGDNYTRLTNYIAYTLNAGMGRFIGELQTPDERLSAKVCIEHFLQNMQDSGMIGNVNGGQAYSVVLDASNNPDSRVALGYQQADVKVKYLAVVEKFLVNVEGSAATTIASGNPALG